MYIVTGPGTVLGFNSKTGEYKIIGTGKGDLSGATAEDVLDFKRGPFNRVAAKALQEDDPWMKRNLEKKAAETVAAAGESSDATSN